MYSSINVEVSEVKALAERLRARKDLLPLKARGLKRFAVELNAISEVGLPWKAVWRILRDVGYQGTYRQFVAMANRLTGKPSPAEVEAPEPPCANRRKAITAHLRPHTESRYGTKHKTRMADPKRSGNGGIGSSGGREPGKGCAAKSTEALQSCAVQG